MTAHHAPLRRLRVAVQRASHNPLVVLATILWGLVHLTSAHADWPQWRGPQHDGHAPEDKLAEKWPDAGPPVLWTRELGQGYSGFVVADGRAITQTQSLYEQSLVSFDADTGETQWSLRYGWAYDGGGLYPGPRATPTISHGRVYFAAPNGTIGCANATTGELVWSVNPKEQYRGRGTDFGVSASPLIWNDRVIVPVGAATGSLMALAVDDGRVLWTCGESPASYATPALASYLGRTLVIAPLENSLLCADAETGHKLWELDLSHGYDEHSAAVVYREPFLMMSGPFRSGARCYRLIPDGDPPGCRPEPVWDSLKFSNDIASSVLVGDAIYGFDLKDAQSRLHRPSRGEFRCLDWATGAVNWSSSDPGHANVIVASDKLVLFNDHGEVLLARASPDGYDELGRATVFGDEICWTPPALADGRLYLRTHTRAACLYLGIAPLGVRQPTQSLAEIPQSTRFDPTVLVGGEREFPAASPQPAELQSWHRWSLAGIVSAAVAALIGFGCLRIAGTCLRTARGGRGWTDQREGSPGECATDRGFAEAAPAPATHRFHVGLTPLVERSFVRGIFWLTVLAVGCAGSAWLNRSESEFVFTWPLTIWALLQLAVDTSVWAGLPGRTRSAGWLARGAGLMFLGGCGAYFHLCRQLGVAIEWSFLTGCLPAFPVAAAMGWVNSRRPQWFLWWPLVGGGLSFSAYFWASVVFMRWWLRTGS
ncbi:MAG TPA: PQQ-binding-like beta-propeller repeat protein [Planctomycetaceae bacterium]|nr:PQQ-binding-like beta-propeller repeat protein [Planctomycetaceae bacterium]